MSKLQTYQSKRNFQLSPEPSGERDDVLTEAQNRFVIQHHLARNDHYDFRIQLNGVLVSWAIPKEPSHDPEVKRLAVKVEDHPLDYFDFEGNIPEKAYGAGTVIVWDKGHYYSSKNRDEELDYGHLQEKIDKGAFKIFLDGEKLKGTFAFFRLKDSKSKQEQWIMKKHDDEYSNRIIPSPEQSVKSGKTLEDINPKESLKQLDENGQVKKVPFPGFIKPMLASLTEDVFNDNNWLYELKLDGYRALAARNHGKTELFSRNERNFNENYPEIANAVSQFSENMILDGEIVVLDERGKSDFQRLQHIVDDDRPRIYYIVFDLLWLNGYSLLHLPLEERKKLLKALLDKYPDSKRIRYSDHVVEKGSELFRQVEKQGLEGIIAKRIDSTYSPGKRAGGWLKMKVINRQEVIICGYTPPQASRKYFGALITGIYKDGQLKYTGKVGTGFDDKLLKEIHHQLQPLHTTNAHFKEIKEEVQWVKPQLLAEVKFSEWTRDNHMRHPAFVALRNDKKPADVHKEEKIPSKKAKQAVLLVEITNRDKVFWPKDGYTKGDVADYYRAVAQVLLPYLKNRPQSLYRTPNGINKKGFFQKDVSSIAPDWLKTIEVEASSGRNKQYMLCQDIHALMYMVNLGCIEINPWMSSVPNLDNPDYLVFDLDPVDVHFATVVKLARGIREIFDNLGLPFFCKTSGSRGLHIYLPVKDKYSFQQGQDMVKLIEMLLYQKYKDITSFERKPSNRQGKIYLDYLQNGKGKTMSTVYSLRPKEGAMVSTPLHPQELTDDLNPLEFNIITVPERINKIGDVWQGFFDMRVDIQDVFKALEKYLKR